MNRHKFQCFLVLVLCGCALRTIVATSYVEAAPPTSASGEATLKPPLTKEGYLGSPLVEVTPFVFHNRLYRLENHQKFFDLPGSAPGDRFLEDEVRIREVETDELSSVALVGHAFASALVHEGVVYVFAGKHAADRPWRKITEIVMTYSSDLKTWSPPVTILRSEEEEVLFNVAVCWDGDRFVLLYETDDARWPAFTFKYCENKQIQDPTGWRKIEGAIYGREKYVGGPALYYENGWYYTLYLQALPDAHWETCVTRSRDLLRWQDAAEGRPFVSYDTTKKSLPLRPPQLHERNASDAELCYFDGKTIVLFTGSDQQVAGDLQRATFDGTPQQLLESFFATSGGADMTEPEHAGDWYPVLVKSQTQKGDVPIEALRKSRPSTRQLRYQQDQLGAFVHFGPATYNGCDMLAVPPAEIFDPKDLDANQWTRAAKSFGAKHVILTAKHHSGFCLWPTKTTEYSVASSPWKEGKGDVVRELAEACRKQGLRMGLYLSAGDFHFGCTSTPDPLGKRKLRGDRTAYFEVYLEQLRELLTEYGEITALWIDGAFDPFGWDVADPATGESIGSEHAMAIRKMIRELQPDAVLFGANVPDVRWSGSEQGWSPYPLWNVVKHGTGPVNWISPEAEGWFVVEANVHTRNTWFWTPDSDSTLKTPAQLLSAYGESIGRGGNLLINMTPDTSGLIPPVEVETLKAFGRSLASRFADEAARTDSGQGWARVAELELAIDAGKPVNQISLEEDLMLGQRVLEYSVEARVDGEWRRVANGLSIGRRRIERFDPVVTDLLRLKIVQAIDVPNISSFVAYHATEEP